MIRRIRPIWPRPPGVRAFTTTRHQRGCSNESKVVIMGTKGEATISRKDSGIRGEFNWSPPDVKERDSHQIEHDDFFAALRAGEMINNGHYMANSTMVAILARMGAYTGQTLTWEQGMNSQLDLSPSSYDFDGVPVAAEIAATPKNDQIAAFSNEDNSTAGSSDIADLLTSRRVFCALSPPKECHSQVS